MDAKQFFKNKSIFLTGGTGSFGNAFVEYFIKNKIQLKKLIIFSRDELKQTEMEQLKFPNNDYPYLRYFIGDIRDKTRLEFAMENVDFVVHAAALKHVSVAEYNPTEFIQTNIIGTQNLIEVAKKKDVKAFVSLSTDKASSPVNLYGATKLCSDKLVISSNNNKGASNIKFSVVRYGNVFGSRGSIVPILLKRLEENKPILLTHPDMTRFNISLESGVDMVIWSLMNAQGGEILVPKIPSYRVIDLLRALGSNDEPDIIGIRPGEKIHEEMVSAADSFNTIDIGKFLVILSSDNNIIRDFYINKCGGIPFEEGKSYNSLENKKFLKIQELKSLINNYSDKY